MNTPTNLQYWHRRGNMVYTEDHGPGTAHLIAEYNHSDEADNVVNVHNHNVDTYNKALEALTHAAQALVSGLSNPSLSHDELDKLDNAYADAKLIYDHEPLTP